MAQDKKLKCIQHIHLRFTKPYTVMRHLTMGIRSEKCVIRPFCCRANVIDCTYTNLDTHLGSMI